MDTTTRRSNVSVAGAAAVDSALLDAFWEYDRALLANDVAALDALFAPGDETLRGDGSTIVIGHDEIAAFRAARTAIPTRQVATVTVQGVTDDAALIVAGVVSKAGAKGMQTQLWRRFEDGWKVSAAHVSSPVSSIDKTIWRVVGAPLIAASHDGVLAGETVAVKDLFAIEGQVVGAGLSSRASEATPSTSTAPAVASLLNSGASVVGLAHTDQLAFSIAGTNPDYGTPLNVQAPNRIPGGSTSGPASAVAQGLASIGLGTDTAGSIRVPASYQGLWGLRTTHGLVPVAGVLGLAPSFDTVGWITRDAAALRRVATVLTPGTEKSSAETELVSCDLITALGSSSMQASFLAACARLGARTVHLDADIEAWFAAFRTLQGYEAWQLHGAWITQHPGALAADVAGRFDAASHITGEQASTARRVLTSATEALRTFLEGRVLLLPATAGTPPLLGATSDMIEEDRGRTLRLTCFASIAGVPAVAAPLLRVDGLRAGLCFVGQERTELSLIDTAQRSSDLLLT